MSSGHVGICVQNIQEASDWFERLGYGVVFRSYRDEPFLALVTGRAGAKANIWHMERLFPESGPRIELLEYVLPMESADTEPTHFGNGHLALEVPSVELLIRDLDLIGVSVIPDGENAGKKIAYVRGPSGFVVELVEIP